MSGVWGHPRELPGDGGAPLTPSLLRSTRARTLHDVVPISCLAEFPNVVQMAKVGVIPPQQHPWVPPSPGPPGITPPSHSSCARTSTWIASTPCSTPR